MRTSVRSNAAQALPVSEIAELYGLRAVSFELHDSHYKQAAAIRLQTDREGILLKPFDGSEEQLSNVMSIMEDLRAQGFQPMPNLLKTERGQSYVRIQDRLFYATQWVQGQTLGIAPKHLYRLGEVLADLHQHTIHPPVQTVAPAIQKLESLRQYDQRFRAANTRVPHAVPEMIWLSRYKRDVERVADEAWRRLEARSLLHLLHLEAERAPIVHGDVTRFNVVVEPGGAVTLIDWDRSRPGSRWLELVNALCNTTDFRPIAMAALLRGYGKRRPLHLEERRLIAALFRMPREAWYARHERQGQTVWNESLVRVVMDTWADRLNAAEWLDHWAEGGSCQA